MARRRATGDGRLRELPVGRLAERTLLRIGVGRLVFFRAGPWVALREDGSRLVRIGGKGEPLLFPMLPRRRAVSDAEEPAPPPRRSPEAARSPAQPHRGRAIVLAGPARRRGGPARRHHRSRARRRRGDGGR